MYKTDLAVQVEKMEISCGSECSLNHKMAYK